MFGLLKLGEFNIFTFLRPISINYKTKLESEVLSLDHYKWGQMCTNTCSNSLSTHFGLNPILSKCYMWGLNLVEAKNWLYCFALFYSSHIIFFLLEQFFFSISISKFRLIFLSVIIVVNIEVRKLLMNVSKN